MSPQGSRRAANRAEAVLTLAEEPALTTLGLSALAMPAAGSAALVGTITATYAAAIAEAVAERAPSRFAAVADFILRHRHGIDGDLGWDRATGAAHDALAGGATYDEALAELALRLGAAGRDGEWAIDLGATRPWRFGNLLLPPARKLGFEGAGSRVRLRLDEGPPIELMRTPSGWIASDVGLITPLAGLTFGGGRSAAALCPGEGLFPFGDAQRTAVLQTPFPAFWADAVEEAVAQLCEAAPAYLDWVADVVRYIVPCSAEPETLSSGSSSRMLGVIRITADPRPEAILEMLVHEATHQYYYAGGLFAEVSDPADDRLFYSPAKRTGRTIDKILLAYHAFANVEAAFAACLVAGVGNWSYYAPQFERLVPDLDLMESHLLLAGGSLTELGHALADPLIARRGRG